LTLAIQQVPGACAGRVDPVHAAGRGG